MKQQDTADPEWSVEEHPDLMRPVPADAVPRTAIAPPSTLFPTIAIGRLSRARTYVDRFEADIGAYCWEWRPELGYYWERHETWAAALALSDAAYSWIVGSVASSLGRAFPGETAVQL
jgi:hypothetical protein